VLPGVRVRELIAPLRFDGGPDDVDDYLREVRPLFKRRQYASAHCLSAGEICQWDLWETSRPVPGDEGARAPKLCERARSEERTKSPVPHRTEWVAPRRRTTPRLLGGRAAAP
jgi:hypothetical protein